MRIEGTMLKGYRVGKTLCPLFGLALLTACGERDPLVRAYVQTMDTSISIEAPRNAKDKTFTAAHIIEDYAQRIWPQIDIYNPQSQIARANAIGGQHRFPISPDVYRILDYAMRLSDMTQGAYDLTDAPLRVLWRQHWSSNENTLLPEQLVHAMLPHTGFTFVDLEPQSLSFRVPDAQINVNDLARAYILDITLVQMRRQGANSLRLSSDLATRVLGEQSERQPWSIPIYHPREPDTIMAHIHLPDSHAWAVCDAGPIIETETGRYNRIINPKTGMPAQGVLATGVLAPVAMESVALSRALAALSPEDGVALLSDLPRHHALIIPDKDPIEMRISPGLKPFFKVEPAYEAYVHDLPTSAHP